MEVYYWGLRNPQELAIDAFGNLFTCDNDADAWDTGRLVYILEGGNSGWTAAHQTLLNFRNAMGTAHSRLRAPRAEKDSDEPLDDRGPLGEALRGPSRLGAAADRLHFLGTLRRWCTTTLATALPDRYAEHFWVCNFGGSRGDLETWKVEVDGAGFKVDGHDVFMTGAGNTDVEFGPDGRMYLSCFNNNGWFKEDIGNIYALYNEDMLADTLVLETKALLTSDFDAQGQLPPSTRFSGHADLRVRQTRPVRSRQARRESRAGLRRCGPPDRPSLEAHSRHLGPRTSRPHLRRQGTPSNPTSTCSSSDPDDEIRAQAAKVLVDAGITRRC